MPRRSICAVELSLRAPLVASLPRPASAQLELRMKVWEKVTLPPLAGGNFQLLTFDEMHWPMEPSWVVFEVIRMLVTRPAAPIVKRIPTLPLTFGFTFNARS